MPLCVMVPSRYRCAGIDTQFTLGGGPIRNLHDLTGVVPPMITPFAEDDSIDPKALQREAKFLFDTGVNGIVVGGSTGEGAGLTPEELSEAIRLVVEVVRGSLPILGGVIADNSEEAVRLGLAAKRGGAVGLQVPPPHFQYVTSTEVLGAYYRAITDSTGLPLIIYNVIPWAQVGIEALQILCRDNPLIVGVKQSGGNIHALAELLANLKGIRIYTAIDDLIYPSLMMGADGTISGTSSLFPAETIELWHCVRNGNLERALALHNIILPVWRTIEGPSFPGHIKYAISLQGRAAGKPRAPFKWPSSRHARRIKAAMHAGGILSLPSA
ncbi:MAG: dihydrodipicolinate synthase family protein [Acidobacteria bacterium]|nr:MAG: dihydrodipicolinate synthase family protein [Acidobacteriota bacterium]